MKLNILHLLLLFSIFFNSNTCFSQDIITLKDSSEIESKVIELTLTEVKYRKFSNLNGPIYNISKTEIFMIKYENGEKDVFGQEVKIIEPIKTSSENLGIYSGIGKRFTYDRKKISKKEFMQRINTNSEAENIYKEGNSLRISGLLIGIPSAIYFGWKVGDITSSYSKPNIPLLAMSGIGMVGSAIMGIIGSQKMHNAVVIFNKQNVTNNFKPLFNENGLGIAFTIR